MSRRAASTPSGVSKSLAPGDDDDRIAARGIHGDGCDAGERLIGEVHVLRGNVARLEVLQRVFAEHVATSLVIIVTLAPNLAAITA